MVDKPHGALFRTEIWWLVLLACDMCVNPQIPKGITSRKTRISMKDAFELNGRYYELTLDQMRLTVDEKTS